MKRLAHFVQQIVGDVRDVVYGALPIASRRLTSQPGDGPIFTPELCAQRTEDKDRDREICTESKTLGLSLGAWRSCGGSLTLPASIT